MPANYRGKKERKEENINTARQHAFLRGGPQGALLPFLMSYLFLFFFFFFFFDYR